jgi:hypothetical protein
MAFCPAADAYARAVALALAPGVRLAILELPPDGALEAVAALRPGLAMLATSVAADRSAAPAGAFAGRTP